MDKNVKKLIFFSIFFVFAGCASKSYLQQSSAMIVFKTPNFQYADMGFLYQNKDETKVEIYSSGVAAFSLRIKKDHICMSRLECMSSQAFNQKVLNSSYPKESLQQIFSGKPIFDKAGYTQTRNGFTQKLFKAGEYAIEYSVLNNQVKFRDTINAILIKYTRM